MKTFIQFVIVLVATFFIRPLLAETAPQRNVPGEVVGSAPATSDNKEGKNAEGTEQEALERKKTGKPAKPKFNLREVLGAKSEKRI